MSAEDDDWWSSVGDQDLIAVQQEFDRMESAEIEAQGENDYGNRDGSQ